MIWFKLHTIIKAFWLLMLFMLSFTAGASELKIDEQKDPLYRPILERIENQNIQHYLGELEVVQSSIGGYVQNTGEGLDRFFGSEDLDIISKKSHLTIQAPATFYGDAKMQSKWKFRLQIDLPKTNHRWKLFLSSFDEEEGVGENNPQLDEERSVNNKESRLGGRFLVTNEKNRLAKVDTGVKFVNGIQLNPFISYEDRYQAELTHAISSRSQYEFYLENEDGLAWEAKQTFDKPLSKQHLLRSQSDISWWRKDQEVDLTQRFIYFYQPNKFRANAYYVNGYWQADNQAMDFNAVAVGMAWREQLYKDWLFAELEPRVTWLQKPENRLGSPNYSLRFMLEMDFYR